MVLFFSCVIGDNVTCPKKTRRKAPVTTAAVTRPNCSCLFDVSTMTSVNMLVYRVPGDTLVTAVTISYNGTKRRNITIYYLVVTMF